jgi:hypothetical protein
MTAWIPPRSEYIITLAPVKIMIVTMFHPRSACKGKAIRNRMVPALINWVNKYISEAYVFAHGPKRFSRYV